MINDIYNKKILEFAADMDGFNTGEILAVQSVLLDPTSFSPIH